MLIDRQELQKYAKITDAQRKIRDGNDFIDDVMDRFLNGTHMTGIQLPFRTFDKVFRMREEEITVLVGINGAGKSLFASMLQNHAINQGYKCLSISMEMSPSSIIARQIRQATLQQHPTIDGILAFAKWIKGKMYYYDQHGSVDSQTLGSVIRYAVDKFGVKFILVDSLMTMSFASDDWNSQKMVVGTLANIARNLGVHIMLVCHARKGNDIEKRLSRWDCAGSADITNRADNVIILGREHNKDGADAYLSLCKARHWDGAEMDIDLCFDIASLTYFMHDELPKPLISSEEIRPEGGVMGGLETMHLND
jgi:twinkle protein